MKLCRNCNLKYGDDVVVCVRCGSNLDDATVIVSETSSEQNPLGINNVAPQPIEQQVQNPQQGMNGQLIPPQQEMYGQPVMQPQQGMYGQPAMQPQQGMYGQPMPPQQGMYGQPMPPQQSMYGQPMQPKPPKKPRKKPSKKLIIALSILAVAIIGAVVTTMIIFKKPSDKLLKKEIIDEFAEFELDGKKYSSELSDFKITERETEDGEDEAVCEVTFTGDMLDRTIYIIVESEKENPFKWDVEDIITYRSPDIKLSESYANTIAESYEVEGLSNFRNESDDGLEYKFTYDIDDKREMLSVTGEVTFYGDISFDNSPNSDLYTYSKYIDLSNANIETSIEGTYREVSSTGKPGFGVVITSLDDNLYNFEVSTTKYGYVNFAGKVDTQKIFDKNGEYCFSVYAIANDIEYILTFDDESIVEARVISDGYSEYEYQMEEGEFDIEKEEDQSSLDDGTPISPNGEKIYIYSWNTELGNRLEMFFEYYPELYNRVEYISLDKGGTSEDYYNAINDTFDSSKPASIVAYDYAVSDYFFDRDYYVSMESVGISNEEYGNSYQYNIDYATDNGELMALSWQANVGCFTYRSDIAIEVFGTDDPEVIQEKVKDWDSFLATAEELKQHGYYMISSTDDITFQDYNIAYLPDQSVVDAVENNNYSAGTYRWSSEWNEDMTSDVFGYFGCQWFVNWSLWLDDEGEITYKVCEGPMDFAWGGTYLGITRACPDKQLAALILYTLCCDSEAMYENAKISYEMPNNIVATEMLIEDGETLTTYNVEGQNPLPIYHKAALELKFQ